MTQILVDSNDRLSRMEGYSFSFLHKWNMLVPLMGRQGRDTLAMTLMLFALLLSLLGLRLYIGACLTA